MHEETEDILNAISAMDVMSKDFIKSFLHTIDIEREKLEQDYKDTLKDINIIIRAVRTKCKHEETQYIPDASGNNDSCHVCLICGTEKKRFKPHD